MSVSTVTQARRNVGVAIDHVNRDKDDFYPTPERATKALLDVEPFYGSIWEPACGDGAISKVLESSGHCVVSTDLVDRGYGIAPVDFLQTSSLRGRTIVTNPPFKLATQFMRHAWSLGPLKMAFLLRLSALEGKGRGQFFDASPLARVWVFRSRLSIYRRGEVMKNSGVVAMAWLVWDRNHTGAPTIGWLP